MRKHLVKQVGADQRTLTFSGPSSVLDSRGQGISDVSTKTKVKMFYLFALLY